MSTSTCIRKSYLVLALLVIVLFIISAACSFADKGKSYRPDEKSRDKQSEKYRPGNRDSKTVEVKTDKSYRPDSKSKSDSNRDTNYKPGTINNRDDSKSYKPGTINNRDDSKSYKPGTINNRDDSKSYKPGTINNRDDSKSYKPGTINNRDDSKSYKPGTTYDRNDSKSYKPGTTYDRNDSKSYKPGTITIRVPKTYKPPTYKSGRYYYSSRNYRPYRYGYWTFDYHSDFSRKSCYYHYGFLPYIQITRIYETPRPSRHYYDSTYTTYDKVALDRALEDIKYSWESGRFDLLERHVRSYSTIAVALDGRYDYSISGEDYLEMTHDALEDIQTVDFVWEKIRDHNDGSLTAYARHTYYDSSRYDKVVFTSYELERFDGNYIITEVDSSLQRLY